MNMNPSLRDSVPGGVEAISERRLLRRTDRPAPEDQAAIRRSDNRRRPFEPPRNDDTQSDWG